MPPHCTDLGIQLRQPNAARALTLSCQAAHFPPGLELQSPGPVSPVWSQQLPGSCCPTSCSWSLEKPHPLPGTAWTTEQEVGAGDNYISRSVEVPPSNLVKNSFIHMYFGRMQRLEVLCVYLGSRFLTCLSFPRKPLFA